MTLMTVYKRAAQSRGLRSIVCATALIQAAGIGGCGLHLHNPGDAALAKKASDSFTAADLDKYIENERAVLRATHERGLAATRRNMDAELDAMLVKMLNEEQTVTRLRSNIDNRLTQLGESPNDNWRAISQIDDDHRDAMIVRDRYMVLARTQGVSHAPSFPPTESDFAKARSLGDVFKEFEAYAEAANSYTKAVTERARVNDGVVKSLTDALREATALQSDIQTRTAEATNELEKALKLRTDGRDTYADLEKSVETIRAALAKFDSIVEDLKDRANKAGLSELLAAVDLQRLVVIANQMQAFFTAWSSETASGGVGEEGAAGKAGRAIGVLVDAGKTFQEASTRTRLIPIVAEQSRIRIETERLKRRLARGQSRIELLESQLNHATKEASTLIAARNGMRSLKHDKVGDILGSDDKPAFLHVVMLLSESTGVHRRRFEELRASLISLDHDEALDSSESALDLWVHTIAIPLEQLVAYHASGIKPEEITEIVKAGALVGIAADNN